MAALHLIVEWFHQGNVTGEAVYRELGLNVAADDGVTDGGVIALVGVGGFYVGYYGVGGPVDVFVDEDGVSAFAELGVVVVVVQDANYDSRTKNINWKL